MKQIKYVNKQMEITIKTKLTKTKVNIEKVQPVKVDIPKINLLI